MPCGPLGRVCRPGWYFFSAVENFEKIFMLFWPGCTAALPFHFLRLFSGAPRQNRPVSAKKVGVFSASPFFRPPLVDSGHTLFRMFLPLPSPPPATSHGFLPFSGFSSHRHYTICTQVSSCGGHHLAVVCHFFCAVMQVLPIRLSWTFLTALFFTNEKNRTILHDTGALFQKRADFYLLFYKDVCIIY